MAGLIFCSIFLILSLILAIVVLISEKNAEIKRLTTRVEDLNNLILRQTLISDQSNATLKTKTIMLLTSFTEIKNVIDKHHDIIDTMINKLVENNTFEQ